MIYVVPEFTINEAITLENDLLTQIPDPDFTFDFRRVRNFDPFSTRMRRQTRSRRALSWTPNKNEYADNDYEKDRYRVTRRDASQWEAGNPGPNGHRHIIIKWEGSRYESLSSKLGVAENASRTRLVRQCETGYIHPLGGLFGTGVRASHR